MKDVFELAQLIDVAKIVLHKSYLTFCYCFSAQDSRLFMQLDFIFQYSSIHWEGLVVLNNLIISF